MVSSLSVTSQKNASSEDGATDVENLSMDDGVSNTDNICMEDATKHDHGKDPCCAICLEKFMDGDEISYSYDPLCHHEYHALCIVEWLMKHPNCPYCRRLYIPIPLVPTTLDDNVSMARTAIPISAQHQSETSLSTQQEMIHPIHRTEVDDSIPVVLAPIQEQQHRPLHPFSLEQIDIETGDNHHLQQRIQQDQSQQHHDNSVDNTNFLSTITTTADVTLLEEHNMARISL
jgi:hypothetical protein